MHCLYNKNQIGLQLLCRTGGYSLLCVCVVVVVFVRGVGACVCGGGFSPFAPSVQLRKVAGSFSTNV